MSIIKNIVIINTVPINGGDEALLNATILGLQDYYPNPSIIVLTNNPLLCREYINYVKLDWDWEYAFMQADLNENRLIFKIKNRIRHFIKRRLKLSYYSPFSRIFSSFREKRVYKILSNSDLVILGAGGYIHDFYGYDKRLQTLEFIEKEIKKPYVFFSQSIGPFWEEKNYLKLINAFDKARKIILREDYSMDHLKKINYHCENVFVTNDIAFYLYDKFFIKADLNKKLKKIAINFREWGFEEESKDNYNKAKILCEHLINKGFELTFISTCQGVKNYVDDSFFATRVVKLLSFEQQGKCNILKKKYSLIELLKILSKQDAYIGMRLHGAILSLIAGIPALNIAYEDKSLGIFKSLGLANYCFSYKEEVIIWINKVENFVENYIPYLNNVEKITKEASQSVKKNFELLDLTER